MENNPVVIMIDEEIARLTQVRNILQSLLSPEAVMLPTLFAEETGATLQEPEQQEEPVRHKSRRGISTGRRGPRRKIETVPPRPLDAAVPSAPVVVKRPVVVSAKPKGESATTAAAPDGTLEALVRSLRPELRSEMTGAL